MNRHSTVLCALLGILVARCSGDQAFLQKALTADASYLAAQKDGFHSHLQRMLQVEPVPEVKPGAQVCSPAALKRDGGCKETDADVVTIPKPETASSTSASSVGAPNCTGPNCLVAPMPSEVPASNPNATEVAKGNSSSAPQSKPVTYGPMTHEAFERMAQRKRTSLKAKLEGKGTLNSELDSFLSAAPIVKDEAGIPLPSRTTNMPAEPPIKKSSSNPIEEVVAPSPAPEPTISTAATARSKDDFEMVFEPQTPSPDPHYKAAEVVESPAPAHPAKKVEADFEMRFAPLTPSSDPQLAIPEPAESPAAAPLKTASSSTTCTPPSSSSSGDACATPTTAAANGPARPPMTEAEAARIAAQAAVNAAARDAALSRKREQIRSEQEASQAKKGGNGSAKTKELKGGAQSPSAGKSSRTASSGQRRVTEVERTLLSDGKAASAQKARPQPTKQTKQQPKVKAPKTNASPAPKPKANGVASGAAAAVVSPALVAAASPRWDVLDYLCVLSVAGVVVVALFVAAAIVEDMTSARQVIRQQGTPLLVHWVALARSLWRRCRRAFAFAAKHLSGHHSELPLSAQDSLHGNVLASILAKASTFLHVFFAHLSHLRISTSGRSRASSAGGAGLDPAVWGPAVAATSSSSPFAAAAFQQSTHQQQQAYAMPMEDSSTATAMAELQLRRRH